VLRRPDPERALFVRTVGGVRYEPVPDDGLFAFYDALVPRYPEGPAPGTPQAANP
jgi:hypothetical protein